jgi:hypothetical protein
MANKSQPEKPKAYFAEDLIAIYTAFRDRVHSPRSVLYPSSGFDGSLARVFQNVTFVDLEKGNEGCVDALVAEGLHAIKGDIRLYRPREPHDLLILLNPAIPSEWATEHLAPGGYIIANDYHNNATQLHDTPNKFTLWGAMDWVEKDRRKKDYRVRISRDLEGLFDPVKDAEEFQRLRPETFEFMKDMVESFARQGLIQVPANAPFETQWAQYRKEMKEGMPYKRVAERYIFQKK